MKNISQKTIYRLVMISVIWLFIALNLFTGKLSSYYGLSADFTGEKLYSLSDATKSTISGLQNETTIYIFSAENTFSPVLAEILSRYAKLSPKINLRFTDPYTDSFLLNNYRSQGFTIGESDILVEGTNGSRHIKAASLFSYDNTGNPRALYLEEKLTNALVYVNTGSELNFSLITGHGENNPLSLEEALDTGGFSVRSTALLTGERPPAGVAAIIGPQRDFLGEEISILEDFLENGGNLMLFMGPGGAKLSNLEDFLASWGLSFIPGAVFEPLAHSPGNMASLIPLYGMHELNLDFAERSYFLAMPGTQAIEIADDSTGQRTTRLLLSSRDAYIQNSNITAVSDNSASDNSFVQSPGDLRGPFVLAAVSGKTGGSVMLFGSSGILAEDIFEAQAFANREYIVRAALWLAGRDKQDYVSIPAKSLYAPPINAGFALVLAVLLVFAVLLPLSILVTGAVILIRRGRR